MAKAAAARQQRASVALKMQQAYQAKISEAAKEKRISGSGERRSGVASSKHSNRSGKQPQWHRRRQTNEEEINHGGYQHLATAYQQPKYGSMAREANNVAAWRGVSGANAAWQSAAKPAVSA